MSLARRALLQAAGSRRQGRGRTPVTEPGFPDFQDRTSSRGVPLINSSAFAIGGSGSGTSIVPLNNYTHVDAHVFGHTVGLAVVFASFGDAAGSFQVESYSVNVPVGMRYDLRLPVAGDFVSFSMFPAGGVATTAQVYVTPVNAPTGGPRFTGPDPATYRVNNNLLASASIATPLNGVVAGEAWALVDPNDATGKLEFWVSTLNASGVTDKTIYHWPGPTATDGRLLVLPAAPCTLRVTNNDAAAAHSFSSALVPSLTW